MILESTPLSVMSIEEASIAQFHLVEIFSRYFPNGLSLTLGDLGIVEPYGRPNSTALVEQVLTEFFDAEDAVLVRGSGTGAIRAAFFAVFNPGNEVVFHQAHIYHTTNVTVQAMGLQPIFWDFNFPDSWQNPVEINVSGAFVQHSRQQLQDSYQLREVLSSLRSVIGDKPIITDDNYAVLKTKKIGVQIGADLSTFSTFKLLGPEGVGAVVGRSDLIAKIRDQNRSGGCQVQGHEAMSVIRGMVTLPVMAAIQYNTAREVATRLNACEVPGVNSAILANFEETDVLVELETPIAKEVIRIASGLGAAPYPVGAESRYEVAPMFYRVSKSALAVHPEWSETIIRINPMRSGPDQILSILIHAIAESQR